VQATKQALTQLELLQELFARAWQSLPQLPGKSKAKTSACWLVCIKQAQRPKASSLTGYISLTFLKLLRRGGKGKAGKGKSKNSGELHFEYVREESIVLWRFKYLICREKAFEMMGKGRNSILRLLSPSFIYLPC
jgi:hypothetical protein